MNCCKYIIKNVSNEIANFNFKKCDDKVWYYESIIESNETLEVWLEINSYSTEFDTIEVISKDCSYVQPRVSPTRFITPTVTPSHTTTPTFTPTPNTTPTPTITPSFTPTPSIPPENLKLSFNSFFSDVSFYVQNLASIYFEMTVDWGDGTPIEFFANDDNYTTYHTYNDIGIFTANVFFNDRTNIVNFSLQTSTLFDIKGIEGFPSLKTLFLNQNNLPSFSPIHPLSSVLELINLDVNYITSFDPLYPLSNNLVQLELKNNYLSNFNPTNALPSSLQFLDLRSNDLNSFNPTTVLPSNLKQLLLSSNPLTGFTPTQTINNGLQFLYLDGCSLTTDEIENTLDYLSATTWTSPNSIFLNNQTTQGCIPLNYPSYLNLISQGWNITADFCSLDLYFDNIAYADLLVGDSGNVSDWNTYLDLPNFGTPFSYVVVNGNTVSLYGGYNIELKDYSFRDYTHLLKFIDNGGSVTTFGEECFGGPLGTSSLQEIFSHGVENTSYRSFYKCNSLTTLNLPTLKHLAVESFSSCENIIIFDFPSVLDGNVNTFESCISATTFNLPSMTGCSSYLFHNCSSAYNFNIPSMNNLGGSVGDDSVFEGINVDSNTVNLTVPSALMTCNSGFPDGDIIYLQLNFVTNIITV